MFVIVSYMQIFSAASHPRNQVGVTFRGELIFSRLFRAHSVNVHEFPGDSRAIVTVWDISGSPQKQDSVYADFFISTGRLRSFLHVSDAGGPQGYVGKRAERHVCCDRARGTTQHEL